MNVQVFAPARLTDEARRFAGEFEVNSTVSSTSVLEREPPQFSTCLFYFHGDEDAQQIERPLRALARRLSRQSARRLRDLVELRDVLERYFAPDVLQQWLIAPNDAYGGDAPQDWIINGRARDVLWEFRRMQVGEPA